MPVLVKVEARHGVVDDNGREVGITVAVAPAALGGFSTWINPTRDGVDFGASSGQTFETFEAAEASIEGTIARSRSRARRKYHQMPAAVAGPDAECIECGCDFYSGDGHPTMPLCAGCC